MRPDQRRELVRLGTQLGLFQQLTALGYAPDVASALVRSGEAERVIKEAHDVSRAS